MQIQDDEFVAPDGPVGRLLRDAAQEAGAFARPTSVPPVTAQDQVLPRRRMARSISPAISFSVAPARTAFMPCSKP